jgi:tetratricopeptide (TPR) repeat protein
MHHYLALHLREKLVTESPQEPRHRISLGGSYCNLGSHFAGAGCPEKSLSWFARAQETLESARAERPADYTARRYLRNVHWVRAEVLDQLSRYGDATEDWQRAIQLSPPAERVEALTQFARTLVLAGKIDEGAPLAESLARQPEVTPNILYQCAVTFAQAANASGDTPDRREQFARRSIELLAHAREAGFFTERSAKTDLEQNKAFDPLRKRADFQELLTTVKASEAPKAPDSPVKR